MYSIGYDIGSSSIKCCFLDIESGKVVSEGFFPPEEMKITSPHPGWAEQDPALWWSYLKSITKKLIHENNINPDLVVSIGISYQMHGLVIVDKNQKVLRPSIIWCDSRAVETGNKAFNEIGKDYCLEHLLNSPGNFTASKLKWVQENEPEIYNKIYKAMLPGDYIAMKLTGNIFTSFSGLSEGIFWDFKTNSVSSELLKYYKIDKNLLPSPLPSFSDQGKINKSSAQELGLREGIVVSYRAGDQPNNAFSLNVLNPGELAATAGTSGVVYGVIDKVSYDQYSRVNPFAHVNHSPDKTRLGVLLCINGTGIQNSWLRKIIGAKMSYDEINGLAASVPIGSDGISVIPFGNGAERILSNRNIGSHITDLDFNRHSVAHIFRAAQEGIAFSFKYGVDIMKEMGLEISVIRAGKSNMFLSPLFRQTLSDVTGAEIQLYDTNGAQGAARGAAFGSGYYSSFDQAFSTLTKLEDIQPEKENLNPTHKAYDKWLNRLTRIL